MSRLKVLLASILFLALSCSILAAEPEEKFGWKIVVKEGKTEASGSGVAVDLKKYGLGECIVTAAHVISNTDSVEITQDDKSLVECEIVWEDDELDAAIIKPKKPIKMEYAEICLCEPPMDRYRLIGWPKGVGPNVGDGVRIPMMGKPSVLHMAISQGFDFGCSGGGVFVVPLTGTGKVCGIAISGYVSSSSPEKLSCLAVFLPMKRILAAATFKEK